MRTALVSAGVILALALLAGCRDGEAPVRVRLAAEEESLVPGRFSNLGVHVRLAKGWHTYWKGRSDSGAPLEILVDGPEASVIGDMLWPSPERLVSPGEILDHVYQDEFLVIVPVRLPLSFSPGDSAEVRCEVKWVACREACLAGSTRASLALPVTGGLKTPSPSADADLFRRALLTIPVPLPDSAGAVRTGWEEDRFVVRGGDEDRMAFYPAADCGELVDPIADAVSDRGRLTLRFRGTESGVGPARGVIEMSNNDRGRVAFYELNVPHPDSRASE
ncbi:MAG: protein-disulfide reductase DsbD domain-containing protein [Candidatus Eisenbacteria bacterium]